MLSKPERSQIKQLIQNPAWRTVENVAEQLISTLRGNSVVRETEWETLKAALIGEGEEQGIRRFIQDLYNNAQNE